MSTETKNVIPISKNHSKETDDPRTLSKKWGKATVDLGYTVVPSALLRGQARLGIGANELAVLIHLMDYWWRPEDMPWPSKGKIAERLMVSTKTVQRAIVNLEAAGLVLRKERYHSTGGRTSNEYDLSPLVKKLQPIVEDMQQAEKLAQAAKRAAERPGLKKRRSRA